MSHTTPYILYYTVLFHTLLYTTHRHWQDSIRAVMAKKAIVVAEYDIAIRSPSYELRLPSVIALKQFRKNPEEAVPAMSRRKVFIRDGFKCQVSITFYPISPH